jgi:hypothetical protein
MALTFTKATKSRAKLRAAVFGPSGAGKTFTCMRIAKGISDRVAVIDTERGSASKYADRFEFDVLELDEKSIASYVDAINAAGNAGYEVLIVDSLSHAWQELLQDVDRIAKAKFRGNTWSAWSEGTPKQRKLVDAILDYPGHILVTMRSKTEWVQETDNGKTKPVRVGLSPEQGKGIEYEFDLLLEMSVDHIGSVIKDRTGKYQDRLIELPGEAFGEELAAWLSDGKPVAAKPVSKSAIATALKERGVQPGQMKVLMAAWCVENGIDEYEQASVDLQNALLADIKGGRFPESVTPIDGAPSAFDLLTEHVAEHNDCTAVIAHAALCKYCDGAGIDIDHLSAADVARIRVAIDGDEVMV